MTAIHTPVLLEETLNLLGPALEKDGAWMIDATAGEGGHSEAFLSRYPGLRVTAIDADGAILERAKERLARFNGRVQFYRGWSEDFFPRIEDFSPRIEDFSPRIEDFSPRIEDCSPRITGTPPAAILIDLGVSLFHYEQGDRGFSFRKDEPLDMRIDSGRGRSAAELLASLRESELAGLLWRNAEERHSRRIAKAIVEARKRGRIESSAALAAIVAAALPPSGGRRDPATKTFQALRIAVNGELECLPPRLKAAWAALGEGGRIGVISFHSLEDRIVKNFFREKTRENMPIHSTGICRLVTRKPVTAGGDELYSNPPSRSAKLRAAEKAGEFLCLE